MNLIDKYNLWRKLIQCKKNNHELFLDGDEAMADMLALMSPMFVFKDLNMICHTCQKKFTADWEPGKGMHNIRDR